MWKTLLIAALLATVASPVQAYLDPAAGSMLLQLILGGLAGLALAVKLYWHKVLGFFGVKKSADDEDAAGEDAADEDAAV